MKASDTKRCPECFEIMKASSHLCGSNINTKTQTFTLPPGYYSIGKEPKAIIAELQTQLESAKKLITFFAVDLKYPKATQWLEENQGKQNV